MGPDAGASGTPKAIETAFRAGEHLADMRRFWQTHRNPALLFPNRKWTQTPGTTPLDRGGIQTTLRQVTRDCGLKKLRHTFGRYATHLIEAGVDLLEVKESRHQSILTTIRYTPSPTIPK